MDAIFQAFSKQDPGSATPLAVITVTLSCVALALGYAHRLKGRCPPRPPGPPGLPFLGNIFDVPAEASWVKYKEWSQQYGSDFIYLTMLGSDLVILNSLESCRELLEKRSAIYSSKPDMPMANEHLGFKWHFGFMPNDEAWKERRKIFMQGFSPAKIKEHRPRLLKAVRDFLVQLLDEPENFRENGRLLAGAFTLDVTYGIEAKSKDDAYISVAERGMAGIGAVGNAATYFVDFFPAMRYLPSWLPGVKFKKDAAVWRTAVLGMRDDPMKYVESAIKRGDAKPSIAKELLENLDTAASDYEQRKTAIFDSLGSVYAGGSDTVVSSFATFFLAMALEPSVQKKAQTAIDNEIATLDRLPDFTEYKSIPYIEAVVREVLRWRPVVPSVAPHRVTQDDEYKGYLIPSGASVMPNAWAILHDPEVYGPNVDSFDPSRFMDALQTSIRPDAPMGYESFGFGRRICPGLQMAVEMVTLVVISVLAVFDIELEEGEKEREGFGKYSSGLIVHPEPFKIRITPRSKDAVERIRNGMVTGV